MPIVINGTTGISGVDGSAGTPSYQGNDTNTGIFYPAADTIAFAEGGAEIARFDSSGNLGINNTSPAVLASTTQVAIKANVNGNSLFVAQNSNGLTTAKFGFQYTGSVDNPVIGSSTNHPLVFLTNDTERMRITSGGNVGIGTSSPDARLTAIGSDNLAATKIASFYANNLSQGIYIGYDGIATTASTQPMRFTVGSTAEAMRITSAGALCVATTSFTDPYPSAYTKPGIGLGTKTPITWNSTNSAIWGGGGGVDDRLYAAAGNGVIIYSNTNLNVGVQLTGGANSWSSVSDESLKTDLTPIQNAAEKVSTLRAVIGRYKTDDEKVSRAFLIAQDVQKVLPEAVSEDEETGILNLRYTETIPLLVKAIQELNAKVTELEAKLK